METGGYLHQSTSIRMSNWLIPLVAGFELHHEVLMNKNEHILCLPGPVRIHNRDFKIPEQLPNSHQLTHFTADETTQEQNEVEDWSPQQPSC